jgi:ABC-type antimicrobial peptide transport system permease subunit
VGLVTVLVRNVHERRAEWALLSATGFSHRRLAGLVSLEYIALLATGLAIGTVAALIAVWPAVRASDSEVNVWALTGMLAGVLLVGILVCAIASRTVIRGHLMAALRRE